MRRPVWSTALVLLVAACATAPPRSAPQTAAPAASEAASDAATVAPGEPAGLEPSEGYDVTTVTLTAPEGDPSLRIEVFDARTAALRQHGLMERSELPPRAGMVFRYPDDHDGGFWMKNTLIPLSIAYFDAEGVVHTVLDMEPCEADPCPSYPASAPYRGALEVNQGFFAEIGLEPGWRVDLPAGLPPPEA